MRVEDLTKFEGECPNIVVFGTYMDIRVPLTKKWKKIINERGDKPNTYHNCLISYISEQIALSVIGCNSFDSCIGRLVFATGKAISSENHLLLEVPEYTTFKDGDVLSNGDGSFIFILNMHGKYLTSLYASLAAGTKLNISDNLAAHENYIECYRLATDSEKQKMIKALKKSENPKAKEYLKRFFGIKEEPKYDFKPFDKVLVRKEGNKKWNISLFAREIVDDYNGLPYKYECSNGTLWDYCIHFEGNECLLGTTENPEK